METEDELVYDDLNSENLPFPEIKKPVQKTDLQLEFDFVPEYLVYEKERKYALNLEKILKKESKKKKKKYDERHKLYDERFSGLEYEMLTDNDIPPYVANFYPEDFSAQDIITMYDIKCLPSFLRKNPWTANFGSDQIAVLYKNKFDFEINSLNEKQLDVFRLFLSAVYSQYTNDCKDYCDSDHDCDEDDKNHIGFPSIPRINVLGIGSSSIVVVSQLNVIKIRKKNEVNEMETEVNSLLKRSNHLMIGRYPVHNLAKVLGEVELGADLDEDFSSIYTVLIDRIPGDSLENVIKNVNTLPTNKVLKYTSGILNGLKEMKDAGIFYHRDIRPANIMIDEEKDKAVIIDLGIATTDRHATAIDNRRYGSYGNKPNDLVSLGQIMYKMATGEHLFANSPEMERTMHAEDLKTEREKAYENRQNLLPYLKKVYDTVKDENISFLIRHCLTAKPYHLGKTRRLFEEVLNEF